MRGAGKIIGQRAVDLELAGLLQLENGGRGELLGDRTDLERRIGANRQTACEIAQAVGVHKQNMPVPDDHDGRAGRFEPMKCRFDIAIDFRGERGRDLRGLRRGVCKASIRRQKKKQPAQNYTAQSHRAASLIIQKICIY
jgi:hypothetical protein